MGNLQLHEITQVLLVVVGYNEDADSAYDTWMQWILQWSLHPASLMQEDWASWQGAC